MTRARWGWGAVCLAVVAWGAAEAFVAGVAGPETVPPLQRHGRA